jgi:hypothetical protein
MVSHTEFGRHVVRAAIREKYEYAYKEVVTDFTRDLIARMDFLNRSERIGNQTSQVLVFPGVYWPLLTESLQIAQDFFSAISLPYLGFRDTFALFEFSEFEEGQRNSCVAWGYDSHRLNGDGLSTLTSTGCETRIA